MSGWALVPGRIATTRAWKHVRSGSTFADPATYAPGLLHLNERKVASKSI
jgi:hypothetical protein